jgi:superfamily II DNA or RNA helicase
MKKFKFRDCQQQAIDKSLDYINGKLKTPGIIVLPTAGGKSHTIAGIAKAYGKPILVIQPNVDLLEQNYSKFIEMG